mgnify:CR=1 FL=1|tara:strand:+ start:411 stop:692 length:282 start_codon:yes stop_codon:yes gene_type:complete
MTMPWTDEEVRVMDMYLWLDYSIECIWLHYMNAYQGKYDIEYEDEIVVLRMMELVYDLETKIIDLIDDYQLTFSMIDAYKEMNDVSSWPARFR